MPMTKKMVSTLNKFAVVDLFAGPGGLAEGFSSVADHDGNHPFHVVLSVEKEKAAHSTLLLRTFLRQFGGRFPDEYYRFLRNGATEPSWDELYPDEWRTANEEAVLLELGLPKNQVLLDCRVDEIRKIHGSNTVLIGGPPCQAYSLVGRARNSGIASYVAEDDPKHVLYENYIKVLDRLRPAAFVMENVKGMLSSSLHNDLIFKKILKDLRNAGGGYTLVALDPRTRQRSQLIPLEPEPSDFVLRSEDFGLPQARHRVIVVGIRKKDHHNTGVLHAGQLIPRWDSRTNLEHVLDGMPRMRSGVSRRDSLLLWRKTMKEAAAIVCRAVGFLPPQERTEFRKRINECSNLTADHALYLTKTVGRVLSVNDLHLVSTAVVEAARDSLVIGPG